MSQNKNRNLKKNAASKCREQADNRTSNGMTRNVERQIQKKGNDTSVYLDAHGFNIIAMTILWLFSPLFSLHKKASAHIARLWTMLKHFFFLVSLFIIFMFIFTLFVLMLIAFSIPYNRPDFLPFLPSFI